jgi:hypothetical protein
MWKLVTAAVLLELASPAHTLTVRVRGMPTRRPTGSCLFLIRARAVGGGTQTTCITKLDGFPGPHATIRSEATMTFGVRAGAIRTRVSITQRFSADGVHAHQALRGLISGGTGRYQRARGTISGGGPVTDRRARLGPVDLRYTLSLR